VACGGTTIGKKGMMLASKVLATTAMDLFESPELVAKAKAELAKKLEGKKYEPLMEKEQKPPLDYRLPGRQKPAAD
jgi:aminobenzoyl-glutamate utilization protein B